MAGQTCTKARSTNGAFVFDAGLFVYCRAGFQSVGKVADQERIGRLGRVDRAASTPSLSRLVWMPVQIQVQGHGIVARRRATGS